MSKYAHSRQAWTLAQHVTLDEDAGNVGKVRSEEGGIAVRMCDVVQCDVPASPSAGMKNEYSVNLDVVKDADTLMSMPSSGRCEYKRGVCLFHHTKGEKTIRKERSILR